MSKKRFERWIDYSCKIKDNQEDTLLNWEDVVDLLNEQQEEITYLKHIVSSLLRILSQYDNEKVKKLLEELDE